MNFIKKYIQVFQYALWKFFSYIWKCIEILKDIFLELSTYLRTDLVAALSSL